MKLSEALQRAEDSARETDEYWVEALKLEVAIALDEKRKSAGLTCVEFASRLKTSAAYVTKVLRGESNLTIESLVKLARAIGAHARIEFVGKERRAHRWGVLEFDKKPKGMITTPQSVTSASQNGIVTGAGDFSGRMAA
jgi:ribosome-binding protein aMBF1 (putative translation factor)